VELREETYTLVTSVGKFKWYKPEFELDENLYFKHRGIIADIQRHMTMYGLRVSPANIWRATPWTWLADWGLNIGRNIDRLQEYLLDGVVCRYLYVMSHEVKRQVFTQTLPSLRGDVKMTFVRYTDVKLRREADSPFGFGSPWSTLSPWRLSILAALGISKPTRLGLH